VKEKAPLLSGSLFLWPDHWALLGHPAPNRTHQHASASLLVGLHGSFSLEVDGIWHQPRAALVAPDVPQALDPCGQPMLVVQLDPDSLHWRSLHQQLRGARWAELATPERQLQPFASAPGGISCEQVAGLLTEMTAFMGHSPVPMDNRVEQVCQRLRQDLPERLDVSSLAAAVGLSSSRLSHLFRAETGVSLRRFLLHLKMCRALARWQPGMSFSALAATAGFYDQPHMVRTARRMFDALPSAAVASGELRLCRCQG